MNRQTKEVTAMMNTHSMNLDPGIRSEAFHRVMLELARRVPEQGPVLVGPSVLNIPWAVRLAELAATYLAVLDDMASNPLAGEPDLDEALVRSVRIWRAHGWLVGPEDAITQVVVGLAKEAVREDGTGAGTSGGVGAATVN